MNKLTISIVGVILLAIIGLNSMFLVNEGEYKVVLRFGEAKRINQDPGIAFKIPFIENVSVLPKYQMIYDSGAPAQILTRDKKPIHVDNYTVWRIDNPQRFLQAVQTVSTGQQRIDIQVYNAVRRKLSETDYSNIISENTVRGDLNDEITQEVRESLAEIGISIIDVRIKRTDLPDENKQSVYNRMISDRNAMAALYLSEGDEESIKITSNADREARLLMAQAEADAKRIIAEGEHEAAQIYNEAYGRNPEFYKFYRTLDSYLTSFNNEPVIILPIDSPYTQILLGR